MRPYDFFFFGTARSKLPGVVIRSREKLICEIGLIFAEIPKVIILSLSISWRKWLEWVIKNDEDHFREPSKTVGFHLEISEKKPVDKLFDPRLHQINDRN
jgi:hypothetical protein